MKLKFIVGTCVYLGLSIFNAGALNADLRGSFSKLYQSPYHARSAFSTSLAFGLFPPMWFIAPFITGFYYHGWTLDYRPFPCVSKERDIWCAP